MMGARIVEGDRSAHCQEVIRPGMRRAMPGASVVLIASVMVVTAGSLVTAAWEPQPDSQIAGRRWDVPFGYDPVAREFLVLGGRTTWADYKKPRPYDVLSWDQKNHHWKNVFPSGKDWGPESGECRAPAWKDERFRMDDAEGNVRPNWTVYGTFSLGRKYGYDSDRKEFYFYAGGKTFCYDPAKRTWTDREPPTHPEQELGGRLLWSSLCYDPVGQQFILFGGGNVQTDRGDPGTWSYSPSRNEWKSLKTSAPPPARANSCLAYDAVHKKIVLFGGDRLDELLADTWTFDPQTARWEELKPEWSPAPRGGHALLWLPKARKILLAGGYTFTSAVGYVESLYRPLPFEVWTLDLATGAWSLHFHGENPDEAPRSLSPGFLPAAVDEEDRLAVLANGLWRSKVDVMQVDEKGQKAHGVRSGSTVRRTGPHDPAWFTEGVEAADPQQTEDELRSLPLNTWKRRPTPKLPRPNMDWGSAVFATDHDQILRFSGGHSAYSGTAPIVYDVTGDRYSLPFAPEYPLEYVYSNDQVLGEWSFRKRPWMTGHTYKSTGYDRNRKALVFAPREYTYFFDPKRGDWTRSEMANPFRPNFYVVTVCDTPEGAVAWADRREGRDGLWRLRETIDEWESLPLEGELPAKSADQHGLAYDSRRKRLLFFSGIGKQAGNVAAWDPKTGKAEWLSPKGQSAAIAPSRETVYVPELDAVLIGAKPAGSEGGHGWLLYDCANNAWQQVELPGEDPITRGRFNNSMGLMFDARRDLVWAVGQNSHVHALRLDSKSLRRTSLP